MGGLIDDVEAAFAGFGWTSLFEVAAIALVLWLTLRLLRGTTAMSVVRGMVIIVLAATVLARVVDSAVLDWMIDNALAVLLIVVLVVFQPELRRALEHVGRARGIRAPIGARQPYRDLIPIVSAVAARLARERIGALIVFERQTGLEELADTGVRVGGAPSADLLSSIFQPGSALHDGAVLLRPGEVLAAGCILPTTTGGLAEGRAREPAGATALRDAAPGGDWGVGADRRDRGGGLGRDGADLGGGGRCNAAGDRRGRAGAGAVASAAARAGRRAGAALDEARAASGGAERRRRSGGFLMRRGGLTRIAQEATLLGTVIVLALVIWFVITDAQNREFEQPLGFSLPVSVINLPSNLAVAGEALPVSLTVVGTRSALDAVSPDDFSATIDAQGRAAGQYSLPVRAESLVEDVRVRAVQPETAVLTLQELIRREVPVRVEAANPPPLGFSVGQPSVAPERATVTGIAADVELVEAVVARLDLAGATVSLEGDVLLEPRTSGGAAVARVTVEPRFARVAAPITQEVFRRAVAVRANVQGAPRAGYRVVEITVEPSTVELFVPLGAVTQDSVWTELIDVEDRRTSVRRLVPLELGDAAPARGDGSVGDRADRADRIDRAADGGGARGGSRRRAGGGAGES